MTSLEYDHASMQTVVFFEGGAHVIPDKEINEINRIRLYDQDKQNTHPLLVQRWYEPLRIHPAMYSFIYQTDPGFLMFFQEQHQ